MKWRDAQRINGFSTSASRWDMFHPACTTRLWTVDVGGWSGGMFKSFWFLRNAEAYAAEQRTLFVDITNNWTQQRRRIRNNPENVPPPPVMFGAAPSEVSQSEHG